MKNLYPDLESLHTLKDLKLRSLIAAPDEVIDKNLQITSQDLATQLGDFRLKFSFLP